MIFTCSPLIIPAAWPAATCGRSGGSGSPVNAVRSPSSAASVRRRLASVGLIRSAVVNTSVKFLAPNSFADPSRTIF